MGRPRARRAHGPGRLRALARARGTSVHDGEQGVAAPREGGRRAAPPRANPGSPRARAGTRGGGVPRLRRGREDRARDARGRATTRGGGGHPKLSRIRPRHAGAGGEAGGRLRQAGARDRGPPARRTRARRRGGVVAAVARRRTRARRAASRTRSNRLGLRRRRRSPSFHRERQLARR